MLALAPADPLSGRARGCYTAVERAFGLKEPSSWIRGTEFGLGAAFFLGIPIFLAVWFIRAALTRQRQNHAV